jgi:hypothetical protein
MIYDTTHQLLNGNGSPAVEGDKPITIKTIAVQALLADVSPSGQHLTPEQKLKHYVLFKKIASAADPAAVELTVEEASTVATAAGIFAPIVYGQVKDFFDKV